ncbi:MAG TPA: carboxymuconolactone decarboxylase family protein [Thermoanaerobaculia bacterium]|nr:carboxymuconolactone decarboxylase family protein [Thermoanaerobaculia bacterium]
MAWIETTPPDRASGLLRTIYRQAIERAGRVFQVLQIQSLRPHTLAASIRLYLETVRSPRSPLSRAQREMIATAVSRANGCHY